MSLFAVILSLRIGKNANFTKEWESIHFPSLLVRESFNSPLFRAEFHRLVQQLFAFLLFKKEILAFHLLEMDFFRLTQDCLGLWCKKLFTCNKNSFEILRLEHEFLRNPSLGTRIPSTGARIPSKSFDWNTNSFDFLHLEHEFLRLEQEFLRLEHEFLRLEQGFLRL